MKKTWKTAGIAIVIAGTLAYPAILLYRYISKKNSKEEESADNNEITESKRFFPSYRNKRHPHHRHAV